MFTADSVHEDSEPDFCLPVKKSAAKQMNTRMCPIRKQAQSLQEREVRRGVHSSVCTSVVGMTVPALDYIEVIGKG